AQFRRQIDERTAAIALAGHARLQFLEQAVELSLWIAVVAFHHSIPPFPVLTVAVLQKGRDQLILGAEVAVEAHLVDAGARDHGIDAHGLDSLPVKQVVHSPHDALARRARRHDGAPLRLIDLPLGSHSHYQLHAVDIVTDRYE